jgi:hypothetical protein
MGATVKDIERRGARIQSRIQKLSRTTSPSALILSLSKDGASARQMNQTPSPS